MSRVSGLARQFVWSSGFILFSLVNNWLMKYQADLTAGSLKVRESRVIADLLLKGTSEEGWKDKLFNENVLQTRNPASARRLALLIRNRLETMDSSLWELVANGMGLVSVHACLAAAVKHSRLLGDFLDIAVREELRIYTPEISNRVWANYVDDCHGRDPEMPEWAASTIKRLRSSVFQILVQAGYVEDRKSMRLRRVYIDSDVLEYLRGRGEEYVLRCIQVGSSNG